MATYTLQVLRGLSTGRSLLSCREDGFVDLWFEDDASGRQRWELTQLPELGRDVFNIKVAGGTLPGERYLSCARDGSIVDLFEGDDGSGRQRWVLAKVRSNPPIPAYYTLSPFKGAGGLLSCTADGTKVDLFDGDDHSGRQRWQLQGNPLSI